jgi:hypothetical protein
MGSSKYEYCPERLDIDIAERASFLDGELRAEVLKALQGAESVKQAFKKTYNSGAFVVAMMKRFQSTGSQAHLSYEGVQDAILKILSEAA